MSVIDQSNDHIMAHLMSRVSDRPKLASAVMDVDVNKDELESLPDTAFAWPEKRAFPIHDAGHTLMSCVYREGVSGVPSHVDTMLKEACDVYNIDTTLLTRTKVASAPLAESSDSYLLPSIKRLLVKNAGHVKEAEERLRTEGNKLTVANRALASNRLVQKAAFYGVNVRSEIHKMAGMTVTNTRDLADWLEARREAAPVEYKDGYQKLANSVKKMPAEIRNRAEQIKLAETIEDLDKYAGLEGYYGKKLPDPLMTVFNTTKVAGHGVTLAGRFIPSERLAAYDSNFFSDALGPDIVREASDASGHMDHVRLAQILETLPVDMQRSLASNIR